MDKNKNIQIDLSKPMKKYIENLLDIAVYVAQGPNNCSNQFQKILEGLVRRNYYTLYSVDILAKNPYCASAITDLSRQMIEDWIVIKFMKLKGKEKKASEFINFTTIENKKDMSYLNNIGQTFDSEFEEALNKEYEAIKKQFEFKKGVISYNWAKSSFDSMLLELLKAKVIKEQTYMNINQAYILGNRKNHTSPTDVLNYASSELHEMDLLGGMNTGLMFCFISYSSIVIEFCKELEKKDELQKAVTLLKKFNQEIKTAKQKDK